MWNCVLEREMVQGLARCINVMKKETQCSVKPGDMLMVRRCALVGCCFLIVPKLRWHRDIITTLPWEAKTKS